MTTAIGKTCRVCQKDVTNAKRVKDAKGQYYCAACHAELVKKPGAAGAGNAGKRAADKEKVRQAKGRQWTMGKGRWILAPVRDAVVTEAKPAAKKEAAAKSSGDELDLAPVIEAKTPERPKVQVIVEVEEESAIERVERESGEDSGGAGCTRGGRDGGVGSEGDVFFVRNRSRDGAGAVGGRGY